MIQVFKTWFHRYFSDPQAVLLVILLAASITILMTMGNMLAPVLASIVIAYLLDGIVTSLQSRHIPHSGAVLLVFSVFILLLVFVLIVLFPLLSRQLAQLFQELPEIIAKGRQLIAQLPQQYPDFISNDQIDALTYNINAGTRNLGQALLSYSLASIPVVITLLVYLVLMPVLVFFFLKDKVIILKWLVSFLPKEHSAAKKVWKEMDAQMGNYVKGKVYEILIVGVFTYLPFKLMGLNYALLLAVLVGLSVIVPYIGAVIVTFPVILVAYSQWGFGHDFMWVMIIYTIIQALDGNVVVPLLFSEAVNLHPVAIIVAVLVFGGLWGFWGVFFAIPLATLVKSLLTIWPRLPEPQ
jgi:putative permease